MESVIALSSPSETLGRDVVQPPPDEAGSDSITTATIESRLSRIITPLPVS